MALDVSTLANWIGAVAAALRPLAEAIESHVRDAERIQGFPYHFPRKYRLETFEIPMC
ncbi:Transposase IS66 family protein [Thalassobaculum litoreum DSM 18839]|uniref:Transposase IS66 family protein n=1 Tax=Thalassobaculum litoreum DSM 18839 TaxID=1123362 RepID=A0A8G2BN17_9PROT|nr:Transposase IS66 family protein [Thalassobaculum litoreum DSM 18839]